MMKRGCAISDCLVGVVIEGTSSGRQCASCNTRRTALWRGAEDGTPLCNACGIRYDVTDKLLCWRNHIIWE